MAACGGAGGPGTCCGGSHSAQAAPATDLLGGRVGSPPSGHSSQEPHRGSTGESYILSPGDTQENTISPVIINICTDR